MKNAIALTLFLLVPITLLGGVIFGTIRVGDRPLREGIEVCVQSEAGPICAKTDSYGGFRIDVPDTGMLELVVRLPGGENPKIKINSFSTPTRYELTLTRKGDRWVLRIK